MISPLSTRLLGLLAAPCLLLTSISCNTARVEEAAFVSSVATVLPPAIASYGVAYSGVTAAQSASVGLHLPDGSFAHELDALPHIDHDFCFPTDTYRYMGTRGQVHYLMHTQLFGLPRIVKISKELLNIENPQKLTYNSAKWRAIDHLIPQFHFGYINLQEWEPLVHDAFLLEMEAWDPFLQWQQHQPIWSWEQLIERHAPPTEEAINWEQLLEGHPLFPATAPWKQADDIIILQGADIVF